MNNRDLLCVIISFFGGVVIGLVGELSWIIICVFVFVGVCLWKSLVFVALLFCVLGMVRADGWQERNIVYNVEVGTQILRGYVSAEPDVRETNTRLTVRLEDGSGVLVTTRRYPEYIYGDYLVLSGDLEIPSSFITDSGRLFNYKSFLQKDKILYTMRYPDIELLERGTRGNFITKGLLTFKRQLIQQIERIFPEPHSSLLGGLLLGAKASMGPDLLEQFRITGVIHIVVLSGFNVTIIAEAIMRVLAFTGIVTSSIVGTVSIFLFMVLTGASATVVRASLMAVLVILARVLRRHSEALRLLFIAGFVMVLHNPMILLYDPSFQLSFIATLGLILIVPWIESKLWWIPQTQFDFRGLAAASLGTQIFVLPLLVWMTGEVSLVSPLTNILVLWVVPMTMFIGFIALIVSYVSYVAALPIMLFGHALLSYILILVAWCSKIPFALIKLPPLSLVTVICMYAMYLCIYMHKR